MAIEKLKPSFHFEAERIEQLKQIAPEAFADGKIIWENLQEALGDFIDDENSSAEHFGLFWPGKREARKIASTPSLGTLIPCPGDGIDEENSSNIFIEGENLEVLKLLQKSYANRIKMIYIDPPYNTGNDFIYEDNFTESIEEYLKNSGKLDEDAKPISANTKSDGRYHSKWLSMMYPRIRLARNLLKEDGVIFLSIDENEINNLKCLLNEVFGEENFIGQIIVQSNPRGSQASKFLAYTHEYILTYAKNSSEFNLKGFEKSDDINVEYNQVDEEGRKYRLLGLRQRGGAWRKEDRPKMHYPIYVNPKNGKCSLEYSEEYSFEVIPQRPTGELGRWTWGKEKFLKDNDIVVAKEVNRKDIDESWDIFRKDYLESIDGKLKTTKPKTIWDEKELNYQNAGGEIKKLFGNSEMFDFPKPTFLIKKLMNMLDLEDEIVLDFFAGSGTTADAVLQSSVPGDVKQFICVQLDYKIPEKKQAYIAGYRYISKLTNDRIKKAIEYLKANSTINEKSALNFKSYKLQFSNFKPWKNYTGTDIKELENLFENNTSPLVDNWKPENLLSEILLIEGFPLDSKIEVIDTYKENKITKVSSDFCEHKLLVCLEEKIDDNTIKLLELSDNDIFICLDNAISDKDKVTLQDKGLIKTI